MKRMIIKFKEKTKSRRGYTTYYKDIPKILTRYYFRRLTRKGCWDIELINPDELWKEFKSRSFSNEEIDNHIPRID